MPNSTTHPSTYSYKTDEKSTPKFTRSQWECWEVGSGVSTLPSPFYPHAQAHKMRYSEEASSLRHSGSTSQHPVMRCDSVSMLLLDVVLIFSAWKTNHNANNAATAVFSSSWRSWRHYGQMQAPENSKWYCSRQHTLRGYTPSPKREDSRAVLFL